MALKPGLTGPAETWASVTPDDGADLPGGRARALYVGGAGDLVIVGSDGVAATFTAVLAGTLLPVMAVRVKDSNTTASDVVAVY